jgi:formamidopyrimidine-DNA glycosylase
MPEMPDVEVFKKNVADKAVKEEVRSVTVVCTKVVKDLSGRELDRKLKGLKILSSFRYGKKLFLELEHNRYLGFQFGMTGSLSIDLETTELPVYTCFSLHFKSGRRLLYLSKRKLGSVEYIEDIERYLDQKHMGPDIEDLNFKQFHEILKDHHGHVKSALMNQKLLAGLGNIYTDEALFQAGINPQQNLTELAEENYRILFKKIQTIIKEAIKDQADPERMPAEFLIHHRRQGDRCPLCKKGSINKIQLGGRSTYFCDKHQK